MKRRLLSIITSLALILGLVVFQAPAFAAPSDVFPDAACKSNTSVCGTNNNALFDIIKNVINTLLLAAGIIAIIMIIIGGINYAISSGDSAKITSAKNAILYAIIGLVVAGMSFAIVNFVVEKLF